MPDERQRAPVAIQLADWGSERLLAPMRRLFWPLWALECVLSAGRSGFWLLRNEFLKSRFGACGRGVRLHGPLTVTHPRGLQLGDNVHINRHALIRAEGGVTIGENCHIARNLVVYSMNHDFAGARLPYDQGVIQKPVVIGRNVWIGINVCVAPGTHIGDGAIIAMGAVVAGKIAAGAIVASPKAVPIGRRDMAQYWRLDTGGHYGGMAGYPPFSQPRGDRLQADD